MFDVCIIGGGIAGLMLAHCLPSSLSIAVLTKEDSFSSNTALAQGGIAASIGPGDHPTSHATDTLFASAGHADAERVKLLTTEGLAIIESLLSRGLPFDANQAGLPLLGREAAHSTKRILHAGGDQTGKMFLQYFLAVTDDHVKRLPYNSVLELVLRDGQCVGVCVEDGQGNRSIIQDHHIVLATGGIGQLYSQTSNSSVATGDGLSLAFHAGAVLEDLEFVQFHPTVLTLNGKSHGLISEAVRGEGAWLVNADGQRIMTGVHPLMELAPRDIVARAIEWHWQQKGPVFLDARKIQQFKSKFPSIFTNCHNLHINPGQDLIPVRPGAHFHMGGVQTDEWGATTVPRLYAIGEVASTGVHGANRLASNSLLEGLVFAKRLASKLLSIGFNFKEKEIHLAEVTKEFALPANLQVRMTKLVGILREVDKLQKFNTDFPLRWFDLQHYSSLHIKDIHRYTACSLIAKAALLRDESRGAHYRRDTPETSEQWTGKTVELSLAGYTFGERLLKYKESMS
ncbi:L-aspartate oxidase [Planococcus halocryophilus Or1]|uniref:L-aspartate oxidase n=1 Tax=Planococcus halocryophilus TaxID=1215089 RepID=A0A1C7DQX0_9BACL|nr:L-aspartate oxidase [Planococcus halocryophilus]ANU13875.1 L-aspartate oxidase [Planococcus halocryophilus]EMF47539.1 L-aspartate oxidase [Planococcus halocryophilus Or1]